MSEDDDIRRSVEKHRWHAITVEESEFSPGFLYTIGLGTSWNHPEVIIFGLPSRSAYSVVATLVDDLRRGLVYREPGSYSGLLDDLPVWIGPVHRTQVIRHFGYAMGYYRLLKRSADLQAVQLFWPDESGRLPNDLHCDPRVTALQPRLEIPATRYD